jgi:hypothetical protein
MRFYHKIPISLINELCGCPTIGAWGKTNPVGGETIRELVGLLVSGFKREGLVGLKSGLKVEIDLDVHRAIPVRFEREALPVIPIHQVGVGGDASLDLGIFPWTAVAHRLAELPQVIDAPRPEGLLAIDFM